MSFELRHYGIDEIKDIAKRVSPTLYERHMVRDRDYKLCQMLDELQRRLSLKDIERILAEANKCYYVKPQYSSLDICWVLNNVSLNEGNDTKKPLDRDKSRVSQCYPQREYTPEQYAAMFDDLDKMEV